MINTVQCSTVLADSVALEQRPGSWSTGQLGKRVDDDDQTLIGLVDPGQLGRPTPAYCSTARVEGKVGHYRVHQTRSGHPRT